MGEAPQTIRSILQVTQNWFDQKGMPSARLDAEVLLAAVLGMERLGLYLDMDKPLSPEEIESYRKLVRRRGNYEPVAYIMGRKEFYGIDFEVSPNVLIPRPDTELLVELVLERLPGDEKAVLVDVCTGSGCVAVALAHHRPQIEIWATELDLGALDIARRNIARQELEHRIHLRQGNLLQPCVDIGKIHMVVGNPPYVLESALNGLAPDVQKYEPTLALIGGGVDGLDCHRNILAQGRDLVQEGGIVLLEIGYDQRLAVEAMAIEGWTFKKVHHDLSGHPRVAEWQLTN